MNMEVISKDSKNGLMTLNVEGRLIRLIENSKEIVEIIEGQ
jgi:hypothetical protein